MATVPTSLLDELTDEVNLLSGDAQARAESAISAILMDWESNGGGDVAALREAAYEAIEDVLAYYADTCAAARAAEYYDAVRKAQGFPGAYGAVAESLRNPEATLEAVRYFVGKVSEGAPQAFVSLCLKRVDEETRKAANRCVAYNATKDPAKPRYGRIPRGETCGFCLMLASFGFYAKTIEAAEHAHAHCDCRIVPGFNGKTTVKGYDPDGMYRRYKSCLKALGGANGISDDWERMPADRKSAYIAAHGNSESRARKAYAQRRVAAEIGTRDPAWYKNGMEPKPAYQSMRAKRELNEIERGTRDALSQNGLNQYVLERSNEQGVKTADILLGNDRTVKADYKCPRGAGYNCIDQLARDTGKKADIMILHLVDGESQMSKDDCVRYFRACANRRGIREMLLIDYDGSLLRVRP